MDNSVKNCTYCQWYEEKVSDEYYIPEKDDYICRWKIVMNEEEMIQQTADYYNQILPPQYKIQQQHITKMLKAKKEKAPMKYFNWRKLSAMIKLNEEITKIDIGLKEDWKATHCTIYKNKQWIHTRNGDYYVQSIWDTPIIRWYTTPTEYNEVICMTNVMQCNEETYAGNNEMFLNWHNNREK